MKKVRIFSNTDTQKLQDDINQWLDNNRETEILASNIGILGSAAHTTERYVFYILYSVANMEAKEMAIMMEENSPSVESMLTENFPDTILNPGNLSTSEPSNLST